MPGHYLIEQFMLVIQGQDKHKKLIFNLSYGIKPTPHRFHNRAGFLAVTDADNMGCVCKRFSELVL